MRGEKRRSDEFTYLSVFFVPLENIIIFNESADDFVSSVSNLKKSKNIFNQKNKGAYSTFDCSGIKKCNRLVNQSSWFLSFIPEDDYDLCLDYYNFNKVFIRTVYKISNYLIDEYFNSLVNYGFKIADLFPEDDLELQWVNNRRNERQFSVNNSILGESDLGISIYNYFSDIDNLICPSSIHKK